MGRWKPKTTGVLSSHRVVRRRKHGTPGQACVGKFQEDAGNETRRRTPKNRRCVEDREGGNKTCPRTTPLFKKKEDFVRRSKPLIGRNPLRRLRETPFGAGASHSWTSLLETEISRGDVVAKAGLSSEKKTRQTQPRRNLMEEGTQCSLQKRTSDFQKKWGPIAEDDISNLGEKGVHRKKRQAPRLRQSLCCGVTGLNL